jgi:hypothetical protein
MKTFHVFWTVLIGLLFSSCAPGPIAGPTSGVTGQSPHNSNSEGTRPELQ